MNTNEKKSLKVLGVIPARFESTRLPRKMLKDLEGKTLIQRTYERTLDATSLDALVIATDSNEIEEHARSFDAKVIRSRREHESGTDRAAEAAELFTEFTPDIVAVIWGDEPMYPASVIDSCVTLLKERDEFTVTTAAFKISDSDMIGSEHVGTVVTDLNDKILYISRSLIPHNFKHKDVTYYHSTGVMVMRFEFIKQYGSLPQTPLEQIEGVEQLRIIENGYAMGVVRTDTRNIGVNTPEEFERVQTFYASQNKTNI
jgi:3-deoxy-manno-octulosonate cytidylyltransferase (CMP-KDO synthetase)